jgi:hypothetical protein
MVDTARLSPALAHATTCATFRKPRSESRELKRTFDQKVFEEVSRAWSGPPQQMHANSPCLIFAEQLGCGSVARIMPPVGVRLLRALGLRQSFAFAWQAEAFLLADLELIGSSKRSLLGRFFKIYERSEQPRTSHTPCGEAGKSSSEEPRLSGG